MAQIVLQDMFCEMTFACFVYFVENKRIIIIESFGGKKRRRLEMLGAWEHVKQREAPDRVSAGI